MNEGISDRKRYARAIRLFKAAISFNPEEPIAGQLQLGPRGLHAYQYNGRIDILWLDERARRSRNRMVLSFSLTEDRIHNVDPVLIEKKLMPWLIKMVPLQAMAEALDDV